MTITKYGYHGTTQEAAEHIIAEHNFIDSNKNNEWLGSGVYFFEYRLHAEWWISVGRLKWQETSILKAELNYTKDQELDLDDPAQLNELDRIVQEYVKLLCGKKDGKKIAAKLLGNTSPEKWAFACNTVRKLQPNIGIILYTFPTNPNLKLGVSGFRQTQRQMCVSNHAIIGTIQSV